MGTVTYSGRDVRYGGVWFADEFPPHQADIVKAHQSSKPLFLARCSGFWPVEIDLGKLPDVLNHDMVKNTRYEISHAERQDSLTCGFCVVTPSLRGELYFRIQAIFGRLYH